MAEDRPTVATRPRWSRVLRALREARGVTQEGWAALLRVGVNTVGRWETGAAVPNALAEQELIVVCRERGLFRAYADGPLGGVTLTPERLSDLLAEARLSVGAAPRAEVTPTPSAPGPPAPPASDAVPGAPGGVDLPGARTPRQIPIPPTPLIGRAADVGRLTSRLRDPASRLVTVTGMGGVGKTRLALQVASDLLPEHAPDSPFRQGVAFVPLTGVVGPGPLDDLLATAIASALGFALSGQGAPAEELIQFLHAKSMLLVLDDVDHMPGLGTFAAMLVQEAPLLTVLVTSRERLNLRGEWIVDLAGLTVPADDQGVDAAVLAAPERYGAIELFVWLARALVPAFALGQENIRAVRRICELVGGLPLGIELAAGWVRLLTCDDIAAEIERSLDFLATSLRDLPARHRSLRAVCTSSWERLSPEEQATLRQVAIFRGSFTREAAAAVADATLLRLAALVDRSLVRPLGTGGTGLARPVRYELHQPVRQFAAEHLEQAGEMTLATARHAAYYLDFLADQLADLRGPRQREALAAIEAEIAQVRAAWAWAIVHAEPAVIMRATDSLFHFYDIRSWFREGAASFLAAARALEDRRAPSPVRGGGEAGPPPPRPGDPTGPGAGDLEVALGKVLARHGWFTFHLGRQHEAKALLEQSLVDLRSAGASTELIFPLNYLGAVESYLGNAAQTTALCQEALALAEQVGDRYGQAIASNILGQTAYQRGQYAAARTWSERSLAIEQALGNRWSMAYSLTTLGRVAYATGAYQEAGRLIEECLRVRDELGDVRGVALCLSQLGSTALALGDTGAAASSFARSFALSREIGNSWGMTAALIELATVAATAQRDDLAARIFHEALRQALASGIAPQVASVFTACAPLARRSGQPAWAGELQRLGASEGDDLDPLREPAGRLLAWTATQWSGILTVDQAIAAVQRPGPGAAAE